MRRQQRRVLCFAILVSLCCGLPAFAAEDWAWNYNLFLGKKSQASGSWDPYGSYDELGVEASWGHSDEILQFATDVYAARDRERENGFRVESKSWEVDLGLRKTWTFKKRFNVSFGSGPALVGYKVESASRRAVTKSSDRSYGWFFGGNAFYRVGPQLNIGVALHFTPTIDVHINGERLSANATHFGLIIGWGAPLEAKK